MNSAQPAQSVLSHKKQLSLSIWIVGIIVSVAVLRHFVYGLYYVPTSSMEPTMLIGERFIADKISYAFKATAYGDIIIFNDPHYQYADNYFIAFVQKYCWGPPHWTKRVVGLPGDHIQGMIIEGKPVIYRNGKKIEEPYVNKLPLIAVCDTDSALLRYKTFDIHKAHNEQPYYRFFEDEIVRARQLVSRHGQLMYKMPQKISYTQTGRNADVFDLYLKDDEYWVMGDNRVASYDSRFWGESGQALKRSAIQGKILWRLWSIDSDEIWFLVDCIKEPKTFLKKIRWSRCFQYVQ